MDKSTKSITDETQRTVGEMSKLSMDKRQEDPESRIGETSKLSIEKCQEDSEDRNSWNEEKMAIPEARGSPELRRKLSRTVAVCEDARRLKTATLDRMGKMFKIKSTRASDMPNETMSKMAEFSCEDQQSRKEKTKSLGRMLKLVDKNGEPRRLFNHSQTGTLSRMFRRKSTGTDDEENSAGNSNNIGVFSKIINQWKNRPESENATVEPNLHSPFTKENKSFPIINQWKNRPESENATVKPNLHSPFTKENKSSSAKPSTTSRPNLSSSTCTVPSPVLTTSTLPVEESTDIEYPA